MELHHLKKEVLGVTVKDGFRFLKIIRRKYGKISLHFRMNNYYINLVLASPGCLFVSRESNSAITITSNR